MKAYVIGGAAIKVDRHFERGYRDLAYETLRECPDCLDADYLVISSALPELSAHQVDLGTHIAQWVGRRIPVLRVESGETSGLAAVEVAASLVSSGRSRKAVVLGVEKVTEYPTHMANYFYTLTLDYEFEVLRGVSPPAYAALAMKELIKDGVKRECFSDWAVKMHENATSTPHAMLRFKITRDSFRDAQVLAEPLTLYDSFALGDGAAAVVISSSPNTRGPSVEIVFSGVEVGLPAYARDRVSNLAASVRLLRTSLEGYGLDLRKVAAEVHDSYTVYPVAILKGLGYLDGKCELGEFEYLNISGGLKARGHPVGATGVYQVYEVFKLLTDGLGGRTSPYDYGVAHSMSGPDNSARVMIFRR